MSHHTLSQELIKQVGSKGLEGALHANKYKGKWIRDIVFAITAVLFFIIMVVALVENRDFNICNYNIVARGVNAKERQINRKALREVKPVIDFLKEVGEI